MSFNLGLSKLVSGCNWSDVKASIKNALKAASEKVTSAGAGLLESSPYVIAKSPRSLTHDHYQTNFRDKQYVDRTFAQTGTKPAQSEEDLIKQIGKDKHRYITQTNTNELIKTITAEKDPQIRQNMLFANCQNFELALANWCKEQFYKLDDLLQTDGNEMTSTSYDIAQRTTTIKSSLRVLDFTTDPSNPTITDRFKATAVFHWDTAQVDITRSAI